MVSNAHASNTPHRIGQIAKAELLIADRLEAWGLDDPTDRATWLLQQLQGLGWTAPTDPTADVPPLRPEQVGDHRPHIEHIRAVLADPNHPDRAPRLDS